MINPITLVEIQLKDRKFSFTSPYLRPSHEKFPEFINYAKSLFREGKIDPVDHFERTLLESDLGSTAIYQGEEVKLDYPRYNPDGGSKFYVYVMTDDAKVKKVKFGAKGMRIKLSDPIATKNFVARHNCADKKDKTTAGWWSCNLPAFADIIGVENPNNERYW